MNFYLGKHPMLRKHPRRCRPQFEMRPWSAQEYQFRAAALINRRLNRGRVDSDIQTSVPTVTLRPLRFLLNNIVALPGCVPP